MAKFGELCLILAKITYSDTEDHGTKSWTKKKTGQFKLVRICYNDPFFIGSTKKNWATLVVVSPIVTAITDRLTANYILS